MLAQQNNVVLNRKICALEARLKGQDGNDGGQLSQLVGAMQAQISRLEDRNQLQAQALSKLSQQNQYLKSRLGINDTQLGSMALKMQQKRSKYYNYDNLMLELEVMDEDLTSYIDS